MSKCVRCGIDYGTLGHTCVTNEYIRFSAHYDALRAEVETLRAERDELRGEKMSNRACRHSMEPHEDCCLCENEKLRAEVAQLRKDRDELIEALTKLADSVDAWDSAVTKIIARPPNTGMATGPARALLARLAPKGTP